MTKKEKEQRKKEKEKKKKDSQKAVYKERYAKEILINRHNMNRAMLRDLAIELGLSDEEIKTLEREAEKELKFNKELEALKEAVRKHRKLVEEKRYVRAVSKGHWKCCGWPAWRIERAGKCLLCGTGHKLHEKPAEDEQSFKSMFSPSQMRSLYSEAKKIEPGTKEEPKEEKDKRIDGDLADLKTAVLAMLEAAAKKTPAAGGITVGNWKIEGSLEKGLRIIHAYAGLLRSSDGNEKADETALAHVFGKEGFEAMLSAIKEIFPEKKESPAVVMNENKQKNRIELFTSQEITEEDRNALEKNGFEYSDETKAWIASTTEDAKAFASGFMKKIQALASQNIKEANMEEPRRNGDVYTTKSGIEIEFHRVEDYSKPYTLLHQESNIRLPDGHPARKALAEKGIHIDNTDTIVRCYANFDEKLFYKDMEFWQHIYEQGAANDDIAEIAAETFPREDLDEIRHASIERFFEACENIMEKTTAENSFETIVKATNGRIEIKDTKENRAAVESTLALMQNSSASLHSIPTDGWKKPRAILVREEENTLAEADPRPKNAMERFLNEYEMPWDLSGTPRSVLTAMDFGEFCRYAAELEREAGNNRNAEIWNGWEMEFDASQRPQYLALKGKELYGDELEKINKRMSENLSVMFEVAPMRDNPGEMKKIRDAVVVVNDADDELSMSLRHIEFNEDGSVAANNFIDEMVCSEREAVAKAAEYLEKTEEGRSGRKPLVTGLNNAPLEKIASGKIMVPAFSASDFLNDKSRDAYERAAGIYRTVSRKYAEYEADGFFDKDGGSNWDFFKEAYKKLASEFSKAAEALQDEYMKSPDNVRLLDVFGEEKDVEKFLSKLDEISSVDASWSVSGSAFREKFESEKKKSRGTEATPKDLARFLNERIEMKDRAPVTEGEARLILDWMYPLDSNILLSDGKILQRTPLGNDIEKSCDQLVKEAYENARTQAEENKAQIESGSITVAPVDELDLMALEELSTLFDEDARRQYIERQRGPVKSIESEDEHGKTILREFDGRGNLVHYKDSEREETFRKYYDDGDLMRIEDAAGKAIEERRYKDNGRTMERKMADGTSETVELDENRNPVHAKSSGGYEEWMTIGEDGSLLSYRNNRGASESYSPGEKPNPYRKKTPEETVMNETVNKIERYPNTREAVKKFADIYKQYMNEFEKAKDRSYIADDTEAWNEYKDAHPLEHKALADALSDFKEAYRADPDDKALSKNFNASELYNLAGFIADWADYDGDEPFKSDNEWTMTNDPTTLLAENVYDWHDAPSELRLADAQRFFEKEYKTPENVPAEKAAVAARLYRDWLENGKPFDENHDLNACLEFGRKWYAGEVNARILAELVNSSSDLSKNHETAEKEARLLIDWSYPDQSRLEMKAGKLFYVEDGFELEEVSLSQLAEGALENIRAAGETARNGNAAEYVVPAVVEKEPDPQDIKTLERLAETLGERRIESFNEQYKTKLETLEDLALFESCVPQEGTERTNYEKTWQGKTDGYPASLMCFHAELGSPESLVCLLQLEKEGKIELTSLDRNAVAHTAFTVDNSAVMEKYFEAVGDEALEPILREVLPDTFENWSDKIGNSVKSGQDEPSYFALPTLLKKADELGVKYTLPESLKEFEKGRTKDNAVLERINGFFKDTLEKIDLKPFKSYDEMIEFDAKNYGRHDGSFSHAELAAKSQVTVAATLLQEAMNNDNSGLVPENMKNYEYVEADLPIDTAKLVLQGRFDTLQDAVIHRIDELKSADRNRLLEQTVHSIHFKDSNAFEEWREFDGNGKEIHYKDSKGFEEWREYDANGNLIHHKDSKGFKEWREYDGNGKEIHYKDSDDLEEWREYDKNGNLIHYKDSNGFENWREYDGNGNSIHFKDSNAFEEWREYDANGNLIHYKSSNGVEEWREYDANGKEIHYKSSNGFEEWNEYDANGNQIHHKDSDGFENWREFDKNGNQIHFKDSDGFENWREYDGNGNKIHYKSSNGFEEWNEYDANGNQIHYRDSKGFEEWSEYEYHEKENAFARKPDGTEAKALGKNPDLSHANKKLGTLFQSEDMLNEYLDLSGNMPPARALATAVHDYEYTTFERLAQIAHQGMFLPFSDEDDRALAREAMECDDNDLAAKALSLVPDATLKDEMENTLEAAIKDFWLPKYEGDTASGAYSMDFGLNAVLEKADYLGVKYRLPETLSAYSRERRGEHQSKIYIEDGKVTIIERHLDHGKEKPYYRRFTTSEEKFVSALVDRHENLRNFESFFERAGFDWELVDDKETNLYDSIEERFQSGTEIAGGPIGRDFEDNKITPYEVETYRRAASELAFQYSKTDAAAPENIFKAIDDALVHDWNSRLDKLILASNEKSVMRRIDGLSESVLESVDVQDYTPKESLDFTVYPTAKQIKEIGGLSEKEIAEKYKLDSTDDLAIRIDCHLDAGGGYAAVFRACDGTDKVLFEADAKDAVFAPESNFVRTLAENMTLKTSREIYARQRGLSRALVDYKNGYANRETAPNLNDGPEVARRTGRITIENNEKGLLLPPERSGDMTIKANGKPFARVRNSVLYPLADGKDYVSEGIYIKDIKKALKTAGIPATAAADAQRLLDRMNSFMRTSYSLDSFMEKAERSGWRNEDFETQTIRTAAELIVHDIMPEGPNRREGELLAEAFNIVSSAMKDEKTGYNEAKGKIEDTAERLGISERTHNEALEEYTKDINRIYRELGEEKQLLKFPREKDFLGADARENALGFLEEELIRIAYDDGYGILKDRSVFGNRLSAIAESLLDDRAKPNSGEITAAIDRNESLENDVYRTLASSIHSYATKDYYRTGEWDEKALKAIEDKIRERIGEDASASKTKYGKMEECAATVLSETLAGQIADLSKIRDPNGKFWSEAEGIAYKVLENDLSRPPLEAALETFRDTLRENCPEALKGAAEKQSLESEFAGLAEKLEKAKKESADAKLAGKNERDKSYEESLSAVKDFAETLRPIEKHLPEMQFRYSTRSGIHYPTANTAYVDEARIGDGMEYSGKNGRKLLLGKTKDGLSIYKEGRTESEKGFWHELYNFTKNDFGKYLKTSFQHEKHAACMEIDLVKDGIVPALKLMMEQSIRKEKDAAEAARPKDSGEALMQSFVERMKECYKELDADFDPEKAPRFLVAAANAMNRFSDEDKELLSKEFVRRGAKNPAETRKFLSKLVTEKKPERNRDRSASDGIGM